MNLLLLAIAGALGTVCRYEISKLLSWQQLPVATLIVNVLGSFILGFLFAKYATHQQNIFTILGVGFCGGFTTFSTFSLDLFKMIQNQQYVDMFLYLALSVILGIAGIMAGVYLSKIV